MTRPLGVAIMATAIAYPPPERRPLHDRAQLEPLPTTNATENVLQTGEYVT
jgi:hypothetical protein